MSSQAIQRRSVALSADLSADDADVRRGKSRRLPRLTVPYPSHIGSKLFLYLATQDARSKRLIAGSQSAAIKRQRIQALLFIDSLSS